MPFSLIDWVHDWVQRRQNNDDQGVWNIKIEDQISGGERNMITLRPVVYSEHELLL